MRCCHECGQVLTARETYYCTGCRTMRWIKALEEGR